MLLTTMTKSGAHHFTGPIKLDVKKRIGLLWRPRRVSAHCNMIHLLPHVCRNILHCAYKIGGIKSSGHCGGTGNGILSYVQIVQDELILWINTHKRVISMGGKLHPHCMLASAVRSMSWKAYCHLSDKLEPFCAFVFKESSQPFHLKLDDPKFFGPSMRLSACPQPMDTINWRKG